MLFARGSAETAQEEEGGQVRFQSVVAADWITAGAHTRQQGRQVGIAGGRALRVVQADCMDGVIDGVFPGAVRGECHGDRDIDEVPEIEASVVARPV